MHRLGICDTKQLKTRPDAGFTLIELVVVVAIIGIAAAVMIPAVMQMLPSMRLRAAASDLHGSFMQVKGMAVKRNVNCTLTFNQLVGTTNYVYIAYEDTDADFQYDAGETIFIRMEQWPNDVVLNLDPDPSTAAEPGEGTGLSFPVDAIGNPSITFRPTGIPTRLAGGFVNGTTFLISNKTNAKRSIGVRQAGNIIID